MELHNQNSGAASSDILKFINRMVELHESIYWDLWMESLRAISVEIHNWTMEKSGPARKCQTWGRWGYFGANENILCHYSDVTWTLWHLRSPTTWLLVQQFVRVNIIETSEFVYLALCEDNPLVTSGFHSQRPVIQKTSSHHWWSVALKLMKELSFRNSFNFGNCIQGMQCAKYQSKRMMIKM